MPGYALNISFIYLGSHFGFGQVAHFFFLGLNGCVLLLCAAKQMSCSTTEHTAYQL